MLHYIFIHLHYYPAIYIWKHNNYNNGKTRYLIQKFFLER